jgi:hypothetical protein
VDIGTKHVIFSKKMGWNEKRRRFCNQIGGISLYLQRKMLEQ